MAREPIKMVLTINSVDFDNESYRDFKNEIQVSFNKTDLAQPEIGKNIMDSSETIMIIVEFIKTAINEQVIEITDILGKRTIGHEEYWLMCDEVMDHPEIWRGN